MSRGPGRLERAIRALFDAHPDDAFVTDELCQHCYPDAQTIERKHQVAVLRAAWNVIEGDPDWTAMKAWRRGRGWVFCNFDSTESYARGCLRHRVGWQSMSEQEQPTELRRYSWVHEKIVREHRAARDGVSVSGSVKTGRNETHNQPPQTVGDLPEQEQVAVLENTLRVWTDQSDTFIEPTVAALRRTAKASIAVALQGLHELRPEQYPQSRPPLSPADVADALRSLITQNDPDAVRDGLADIATEIDAWREAAP